MHISDEDIKLFYKLRPAVLFSVNEKLKILPDFATPDELRQSGVENVRKIEDQLLKNTRLIIDDFVRENPFDFSNEELKIVASWKHFVRDRFYVLNYLKKYTVFLSEETPGKAYGVCALVDPLENVFGPYLPVLVETTLLPFKNKIIYDGTLSLFRITFGGGFRSGLKETYQEAKARYGVIESLPFQETPENDVDTLKRYLATKESRECYREEIFNLIKKSRELAVLYHQTMGAVHARVYKKDLRTTGIAHGWFAVLQGVIVAGGLTKEEVERSIKNLVPADKGEFAYIFRL